jgi:GTP-binding protein HflX
VSQSKIKVVLVTYPDTFRFEEAKSLVESGIAPTMHSYEITKIFTQKFLNRSKYGIGSGKADEIKQFVRLSEAERLIVDERLSSKQIHNLEKLTKVPVIDRERLILDIFTSRATTTEAKLQIQLAEIRYEMPRVRENARFTPGSGERPGKGGMGEYSVDVKFRDLKRRISYINEKLDNAKRKRDLYQQQRIKTGMPVVSLLGYTSSGKTTLFNFLTNERKETSSSLFTTLSTTTRSISSSDIEHGTILLTDTIGFISRLPAYMIEAFKSTLEESVNADLILLLIDCSEDKIRDIRIKHASCWKVLNELRVNPTNVLVVLTKSDNVTQEKIDAVAKDLNIPNPIAISSNTGYGMNKLKKILINSLLQPTVADLDC